MFSQRRIAGIGMLTGVPASVENKYVPGSGVGASSIFARRAKYAHSTQNRSSVEPAPAPVSLNVTLDNGTASVSFLQKNNGGCEIENYLYSLNGGLTFNAFSPYQNTSPVSISGLLTNGTSYSIQLKAVNCTGAGRASASVNVISYGKPSAPTDLSAEISNSTVSITFIDPTDNGGGAITNYQYSIDNGTSFVSCSPSVTSSPVIISGLTNGTSYSIQLRAINIASSGIASETIIAIPGTIPSSPTNLTATSNDGSLAVHFTAPSDNGGYAITNYEYSIDGGESFVACSPSDASSPITITGLTNGTTYNIVLKAVNEKGSGSASTTIAAIPKTTPSAPTNLVGTSGNGTAIVSFTEPFNGGGLITNYEYSINNGVSFVACTPSVSTTPITITGLTNGTTYNIALKAVNEKGSGSASSTISVIPSSVPDAPTDLSATSGDGTITLSFTEPSDSGRAITNYEYSIDDGESFVACSPSVTTSPITITGLTNGTSYNIALKAVNENGSGTASTTIAAIPKTKPSAPTNLEGTIGNGQVAVSFTEPYDGGASITNYEYSINNGVSFVAFSPSVTTSPITITGLTNGTTYNIALKAVNEKGSGSASSTITVIPSTIPGSPTNLSSTSANGAITVSFTEPSNGGAAITNYEYSIDNGESFSALTPSDASSPITIHGLTNGTTYTIALKAVNENGSGNASSSITAIPKTTPSAPTNIEGTTGNGTVTVSFTEPSDNGSATITNYEYSINGGASFVACSPSDTSSPITITGLTNGTTYNIVLKAVNEMGSGTASSSISLIPARTPAAPTNLSATSANGAITVSFTAPSDNGGATITNYEYSINDGYSFIACSPSDASSPITISGLTNGTTYTIALKAVNEKGSGTASSSITAMPKTTPSAPTEIIGIAGNGEVDVFFTEPSDDGGASITNYKYSINNGVSFVECSPSDASSPITIKGLTNGTTYNISLKAVNEMGSGAASSSIAVIPATTPSAPTSLSKKQGNEKVTVSFTSPSNNGGATITNYEYSIDDGDSFTACDPPDTISPIVITGLTNNTTYSIQLRAVNSVGTGISSSTITATPDEYVPMAGSLAFNGSNKLNLSPGVSMGSGAYTIELWFYYNGAWSINAPLPALLGCTVNSETNGMNIFFSGNNTIMTDKNGGGWRPEYTFASSISLNEWHHLVLVRNSSYIETAFIDGVKATSASGLSGSNPSGGQQTNSADYSGHSDEVGHFYQGYWSGYITNFRLVSGTAIYDPTASSIVVPKSPLDNVANTKYLMLGDSIQSDSAGVQTVTNISDVTLSTSETPF